MKHGGQRGMALVVSLVLLVVALLLSLSSMQSSRLDESMSGNHRAAARALMSAEYGASTVVEAILSEKFSDPTEGTFFDKVLGGPHEIEEGEGLYYTIEAGPGGEVLEVAVRSVGEVWSGGTEGSRVARREIDFFLQLKGLGDLSPWNFGSSFEGCYTAPTSSATETEGEEEEVNGVLNPAISASSKDEAQEIVDGILQNVPVAKKAGKYVFVPSDFKKSSSSSGAGVFHASDAVSEVEVDGETYYSVNYGPCEKSNNPMCNYKGGISSTLGAAILNDGAKFHDFVSKVFLDEGTYFSGTANQEFANSVSVVTKKSHNVALDEDGQPLWVDENGDPLTADEDGNVDGGMLLRDQEGGYFPTTNDYVTYVPGEDGEEGSYVIGDNNLESGSGVERDFFDQNNNFGGSGFLVIDGDVEFKGDPDFEGVIIVLGDYTLSGGGGGDFKGAIISAPYYYDPDQDSFEFQPICVDVSGGGNNDYLHSKAAIMNALSLLSPEAYEAWLTGNDDDTYQYVVSGWREKVVQ